jgi:hypothetical protein
MASVPPSQWGKPPPPPTPSDRPWWKRKRFLVPAGIVLLVWALSAVADEPNPGTPTAASTPATTVATTTTTALPTTTAAPTTTTRPTPTTKRPTPTTKRNVAAAPTTRRPTPTTRRPTTTTRPASNCHPSYQGECLKVAIGDYDCAGGSGNGPNYVQGTVRVVGSDEFDLDRDGDGWGCET